uniref:PiggyBac transposable element derived 5 n=1 Tax=Nothoprocta perdicaria TaxID=30464 RepID=A0A8C6ZI48_NOTPE
MPLTASAMDFFQLFVPDNVLKNMVVQTNMYAKKYQERFGSDDAWIDVTLTEMKAFLGYMISTSIHHCESVLSIWSSGFYSNRSIALIMTQSRFEKILKYFHIVAFRSSQTTHGLYKIQPFLDSLQNGFDSAFRPSQTQVLHEPLIDEDPIFIATCTERELRKRKKRKFSLWVRQCSSTGFICQIYVHLKEGSGADGLDALKNKPQLHSMVAKSLCQNASGKNYIIFTGPSITSLNLFEEFEKQEIYCCGLLSARKSDCTGLPPTMLNNPETPQARGQYRIKMKGNMSLICWYNKGHFRFLTNAYSPVQQGQKPLTKRFHPHLFSLCLCRYFISHKPNKTWQQVFWFAISIAINNAYILYKMSEAYPVSRYSRAQFGERLVRELLGLEDTSPSH